MRFLRALNVFLFTTVFIITAAAVLPVAAAAPSELNVYVQTDDGTGQAAVIQSGDEIAQTVLTYSSLDATDAPEKIIAKGVTVNDLTAALGIKPESVQTLFLTASDGWSKKLDYAGCISERYCFDKIVSGYDKDSAAPPEFEIGTEDTRRCVDPMFAFFSFEGRYCETPGVSDMTASDGIRFCMGQNAISDRVSTGYGKQIVSVTFILKEGAAYALEEGTPSPVPGETTAVERPSVQINEDNEKDGLAADNLTITVGYYGSTYYTKKVFSLSELQGMDTVRQVYSCIDSMPAPCLNSCVGVRLSDILAAAGIDAGSVATLNFYCTDVANTWYQSFTKEYLLDTVRFYYPNLTTCWNYEDLEPLPGASLDAVVVDTIIAYQECWRRNATEADLDQLSAKTRFRLMFGQADVTTPIGSKEAKWLHTIAVTLIGTPPSGITLDASVLELEIGSKYQLSANLEGIGQTTDQRIIWSSSNENAVSVSASGRITVKTGETAVITATTAVGGLSASVVINGGEAVPAQNTETVAEPSAEPEPSSASETPEPSPASTETEASPAAEAPEPESASEPEQTGADDAEAGEAVGEVYEITDAGPAAQPQESNAAVVYNRIIYQMPDTAVQFADIQAENTLKVFSETVLITLFLIGMLIRYVAYRKQI